MITQTWEKSLFQTRLETSRFTGLCVHTQNSLPQLWGIITPKPTNSLVLPNTSLKQTITSKIRTTLDRINGRLDLAEEKIIELEDIAIDSIQNKRPGEGEFYKMSRASVSCGITSSGGIHRKLEFLKCRRERAGQKKI